MSRQRGKRTGGLLVSLLATIVVAGAVHFGKSLFAPSMESPFDVRLIVQYLSLERKSTEYSRVSSSGPEGLVVIDEREKEVDPIYFDLPDGIRAAGPGEVGVVALVRHAEKLRFGDTVMQPGSTSLTILDAGSGADLGRLGTERTGLSIRDELVRFMKEDLPRLRKQALVAELFDPHIDRYLKLREAVRSRKYGTARIRGRVVVIDARLRRLDPVHFELPAHLQAMKPEEVAAVALLDYSSRRVGMYVGVGGESATRCTCECVVVDAEPDVLIGRKELVGPLPPSTKTPGESGAGARPVEAITGYLSGLAAGE